MNFVLQQTSLLPNSQSDKQYTKHASIKLFFATLIVLSFFSTLIVSLKLLPDETIVKPILVSANYFLDEKNSYSITDVVEDDSFINQPFTPPHHWLHTTATIWLKYELQNPLQTDQQWFLNTGNSHAFAATIYLQDDGGNLQTVYKLQDKNSINQSEINLSVSGLISLKGGAKATIYIQYQSLRSTAMTLEFNSARFNAQQGNYRHLMIGFGSAVLLTLGFIHLTSFVALRNTSHLFYAMFVVSLVLMLLIEAGYGLAYLWPNTPSFHNQSVLLAFSTSNIFGTLFAINFLDTKKTQPALHNSLVLIVLLSILTLLSGSSDQGIVFGLQYILIPLMVSTMVLIIIAAIRSFLQGNNASLFYATGIFFFLLSGALYLFSRFGYFGIHSLYQPSLNYIGAIGEGLILAFAINIRYAQTRRSSIESEEKLISTLNKRIHEIEEVQKLEDKRNKAISDNLNNSINLKKTAINLQKDIFAIKLNIENINTQHPKNDNIEAIKNSLVYLEQLVSEISPLSPNQDLTPTHTLEISTLFAELHSNLNPIAINKGISLRYRSRAISTIGSKVIITRILENLIRNAIKATSQGGVIFVSRKQGNNLIIQVIDTGKGIDLSQLRKLQEIFISDSDGDNNHGLGLEIISNLCRTADYNLSVKSTLKKGTVFTLSIPMAGNE